MLKIGDKVIFSTQLESDKCTIVSVHQETVYDIMTEDGYIITDIFEYEFDDE